MWTNKTKRKSPYLNMTEMLWTLWELHMNLNELKQCCKEEFNKILPQQCKIIQKIFLQVTADNISATTFWIMTVSQLCLYSNILLFLKKKKEKKSSSVMSKLNEACGIFRHPWVNISSYYLTLPCCKKYLNLIISGYRKEKFFWHMDGKKHSGNQIKLKWNENMKLKVK